MIPSETASTTLHPDPPPGADGAPGPRVVRLYGIALALVWLAAWWSWALQALPLLGRRGLVPMAEYFARARAHHSPLPLEAPSLFWLVPHDGAIVAALLLGIVCAALATAGLATRGALGCCALLYISFIAPATPLLPQLGDRVLLEATAVLLLLPRGRPAPGMLLVARLLVFKLYLEMGLAQWRSPAGDWQQGLALAAFLESTPLPTPWGWYLAHLPAPILSVLTRVVVFIEVFVPWLILGPRTGRLVAAVVLTALQLGGLLACNYGLFALGAMALHLLLLGERDVARIEQDAARVHPRLGRLLGHLTRAGPGAGAGASLSPVAAAENGRLDLRAAARRVGRVLPMGLGIAYLALSALALLAALHVAPPGMRLSERLVPVLAAVDPWHVVNTYTQLGQAPVGRLEPRLEVRVDGRWRPVQLWHQPGDPWLAPKFVAPHQPRLEVALSAYGRRGTLEPVPHVVRRLMQTLCEQPQALSRFVATPVPPDVQAVRLSLWRYSFAPWARARDTGAWWRATLEQTGPTRRCEALVHDEGEDGEEGDAPAGAEHGRRGAADRGAAPAAEPEPSAPSP